MRSSRDENHIEDGAGAENFRVEGRPVAITSAPINAPKPWLERKPTRNGCKPSCSRPRIGIIAVNGNPKALKTMVTEKTRRNSQFPHTNRTPAEIANKRRGDSPADEGRELNCQDQQECGRVNARAQNIDARDAENLEHGAAH